MNIEPRAYVWYIRFSLLIDVRIAFKKYVTKIHLVNLHIDRIANLNAV